MLAFLKDSASWMGDLQNFSIMNKICNLWDPQLGTLVGMGKCHIRVSIGSPLGLASVPYCYWAHINNSRECNPFQFLFCRMQESIDFPGDLPTPDYFSLMGSAMFSQTLFLAFLLQLCKVIENLRSQNMF